MTTKYYDCKCHTDICECTTSFSKDIAKDSTTVMANSLNENLTNYLVFNVLEKTIVLPQVIDKIIGEYLHYFKKITFVQSARIRQFMSRNNSIKIYLEWYFHENKCVCQNEYYDIMDQYSYTERDELREKYKMLKKENKKLFLEMNTLKLQISLD
jgi:hypothetical protein